MPRSIWKGVISFGMVSIPVKLYSATEDKDVHFHQVHEQCQTRIKEQKYCPHCDRTVEWAEIQKGYEYSRGRYVLVTKEDLEAIPLPAKHNISVNAFVKLEQIDPIFYEKSYYLEPDEAATRPFALFLQALQDKEMVAIATIAIRSKERLCALRPQEGNLLMETLLYPDEIRIDLEEPMPKVKLSDKELKMAEHLIDLMSQDFNPEDYTDHYREALREMIEAKLEGQELEPIELPKVGKVVDLMDALRVSVENVKARGNPTESGEDEEEEDKEKPRKRTAKTSTRKRSTRTKAKKAESEKTSRATRKPGRKKSA